MQLGDLTFGQLVGAGVVILLLLGVYNTVMTAIKNYLEARKRNNAPVDALSEKVSRHDRMLDNDKRKLDEHDRRFDEIDERLQAMKTESSMTLRGVRALMSHSINGNSIERLQENAATIDEYLINKE